MCQIVKYPEKTDKNGLKKVMNKDYSHQIYTAQGIRHRKNKGDIAWHLSMNAQVKNRV
jgi:hypothetical protein